MMIMGNALILIRIDIALTCSELLLLLTSPVSTLGAGHSINSASHPQPHRTELSFLPPWWLVTFDSAVSSGPIERKRV